MSDGTVGLQIAIQAYSLKGEILTTPFTYIASANSIIWENCKPVFVDIDSETFTIDPDLLGEPIADETVAVLAVHVYGYPCHVEELSSFCSVQCSMNGVPAFIVGQFDSSNASVILKRSS